jgi:Uma2 family endonuclease
MASNPVPKISEEQYLALDRAAEVRSEYVDGEMYAMSGGSMNHAQLQSNILVEFHTGLRDRDCRIYASEFRVCVSANRNYLYPDVVIVCGKPQLPDARQDILLNPTAIFEVLSPSTASYDRGPKFRQYRAIESLKEYVLVDQNQVLIERYSRQESGLWTYRDYQSLDDELKIDTIGASVPLRRVYDQVEFPEQPDLV